MTTTSPTPTRRPGGVPSDRAERLEVGPTVADVMLRRPKVLPARATILDARELLADPHVHLALIVDEADALVGTVTRSDLDHPRARGSDAGRALATTLASLEGRTVRPEEAADAVLARMTAIGSRRLAVVSDDGGLLGLLCLKRTGRGFCDDDDVSSRARPRPVRPDGPIR